MNKKRITYSLLTVLMILVLSTTAFAALTESTAREIAERWMPEGTIHRLTKDDTSEFEIYFFNEALNTNYKVEVSKFSETITEISSRVQNAHGSMVVNLSESQVREIVLNEFPDASIRKIKLDDDDGYRVYEVKFAKGSGHGEMDINPETGSIIKWELKL